MAFSLLEPHCWALWSKDWMMSPCPHTSDLSKRSPRGWPTVIDSQLSPQNSQPVTAVRSDAWKSCMLRLTSLKPCSRLLNSRMKLSCWVLELDRVTRRCSNSSTSSYRADTASTAARWSSPKLLSSLRSHEREAPPSCCNCTKRLSSRMLRITALYLDNSSSASWERDGGVRSLEFSGVSEHNVVHDVGAEECNW